MSSAEELALLVVIDVSIMSLVECPLVKLLRAVKAISCMELDVKWISLKSIYLYEYFLAIVTYIPRSTQPGHPSVGRRNEYQWKLGRKQAHRAMH